MEAHTTIFEFRTSNVAPNGSFVTVGNALFGVLCACLCMLQVVLSTVSVYWRYIRPFLNFEIQIWSLAALCNGRKCRLRRSAAFAFCFFLFFFFLNIFNLLRRAPERSEGARRLTRKGLIATVTCTLRARSARLLRRAPERSEGARRLTRRG